MRVAVIGAGVAGLAAARTLANAGVHVAIYEREEYLGGHARTVEVDGVPVDVGFMVFNRVTYPNMVALFEGIGVEIETSDMSFSVSMDEGRGCEWSSNGLSGLFAQKQNILNPFFLQMVREIIKFQYDVLEYLNKLEGKDAVIDSNETLGKFVQSHGYSKKFVSCYLVPMCASVWSCSSRQVLGLSASLVLTFCRNHHLLQVFGRPQWLTVKGRSQIYVQKLRAELESRGCEIRRNSMVSQVLAVKQGVNVVDANGKEDIFDKCIISSHAPDALQMLGDKATDDEGCILGAFQYSHSDIYLHRDKKLMPRRSAAWSAWNFLGSKGDKVCVTYWINLLQNLGDMGLPILVTLNPSKTPDHTIMKWRTSHPIPSPAAVVASKMLNSIQGKQGIWFCGAYQGYGFHEDGLKSGLSAAKALLGDVFQPVKAVKCMMPTWPESAARLAVLSFLRQYIKKGSLQLEEVGGSALKFGEDQNNTANKCIITIYRPAFFWKVATRADLGLADAYIDGDFKCVDSEKGLIDLFSILIENRDLQRQSNRGWSRRGWWSPVLFTALFGSAASYLKHMLKGNSLTNARRNIAAHYDLSNDLFALFLDDTMTYSCALFKYPGEPLKDAQLRKIHQIINKAQIHQSHEVLEIGFGWGSMALEVVKRTGCKYTGITLSEEQLKFAEIRVKEAGLQDKIRLELCDYRTLPGFQQYDRILSCEMLEAVGPEHFKDFFSRCDYLMAKDGILVVQVISIPEERYDEYRTSSDFLKEYIFPGGCLPAFSTLTAAMALGSSFCVEHVENFGINYYHTLLAWRKKFNSNHSEILRLGFSEKFLRMWEYYFMYCAAGFKSCTLGLLQIVFSRPGNVACFGNSMGRNEFSCTP